MSRISTCCRPGLAVAIAGAIGLAGCGGGSSSGGVANAPPPPPVSAPAPSPAPAPEAATFEISAPDRATTGAGPSAVLAAPEGPSFASGPAEETSFPLLQSVIEWRGQAPPEYSGGIAPDRVANGEGAAARIEAGQFKLGHEVLNSANLDWSRTGYWSADYWWDFGYANRAAFVIGYETPAGAVPAAGTATYTGLADGLIFYPVTTGDGRPNAAELRLTGGTAAFTADFGARSVNGSITGLSVDGARWNDVAFRSAIASNGFSGDTRVTSAPAGIASLNAGATGTIEGKFFGPAAQEAGAVWTLYDGIRAAIGTLSGTRP